MQRTTFALALAGAAGALLAAPASAVTCYQLLDRNDTIVYRDIYPPVELERRRRRPAAGCGAPGASTSISMEVEQVSDARIPHRRCRRHASRLQSDAGVDAAWHRAGIIGRGASPSKRGAAATGARGEVDGACQNLQVRSNRCGGRRRFCT